jgi:hypothetical protein
MSALDEISAMRKAGKSDQEISDSLKSRGVSDREIQSAMSQAQIKNAVSPGKEGQEPSQYEENQGEYMPSISAQNQQAQGVEYIHGSATQGGAQEYDEGQGGYSGAQGEYGGAAGGNSAYPGPGGGSYAGEAYGDYGGGYQEYQGYQGGMSADVMTEVAEQVVSEKMANMRDQLEKVIDFRTTTDAKLSNLNDRLRRIEQIIDKLQLSLLQKMGEYVNDVKDIKKELGETQKSFKAMVHKRKKKHP